MPTRLKTTSATLLDQVTTQERRDSTFTYEGVELSPCETSSMYNCEQMDPLRATAFYYSARREHVRTESVDSGIGGMTTQSTDIRVSQFFLLLAL